MYAHEDRLRAVRLYVKLGNRSGATSRQLGFPPNKVLTRNPFQRDQLLDPFPCRDKTLQAAGGQNSHAEAHSYDAQIR